MASSTSYAESPQIPELLYEMGARMKKMSTWYWIILGASIVVSIISIIPIIIGTLIMDETTLYIGMGIAGLLCLGLLCLSIYPLVLYCNLLVLQL